MGLTYKRKYGLDWPAEMSDFQIDLQCWAFHAIEPFKHGAIRDPHELFFKAVRRVLTPEEFKVSRWTEEHVYDYTHESFIITWGCASSSKSWDYGTLALFTWYANPADTIILLATTTRPALLQRTFASVSTYHRLLKRRNREWPGKLLKTATALVPDDADELGDLAGSKPGVLGVAVREGPIQDAVAFLRGRHAKTVVLIADELSELPPAVVAPELLINLRTGAQVFKFIGLTNIYSFDDLAGRHSVPDHPDGWKSVSIDTEFWRTRRGVVRRHDGLRSPALQDPEGPKKWPHLLNQGVLDEIQKSEGGSLNTPGIFRMIRAWPPPTDLADTVISETEMIQWDMRAPVVWKGETQLVAGLDPGYGGDKCILTLARVGLTTDGRYAIAYEKAHQLLIDATSAEPVLYQILHQGVKLLDEAGVPKENLAIDDSGPQSVADVFAQEWGSGVLRVSFGSRPTKLPVSAFNLTPADQYYADRVTEMVYSLRLYGQYGQIRGLPELAAEQVTRRIVLPRRPRKLQSKKDYKQATGLGSPDDLDAAALALAVVRERLGLAPGATEFHREGAQAPDANYQLAAEAYNNLDADENRYISGLTE